jgi:Na+/phosphate symporter
LLSGEKMTENVESVNKIVEEIKDSSPEEVKTQVPLSEEEVEEIRKIHSLVERHHREMGSYTEKIAALQDQLSLVRRHEVKWEGKIRDKYHLSKEVSWRIDADRGIVVPVPD